VRERLWIAKGIGGNTGMGKQASADEAGGCEQGQDPGDVLTAVLAGEEERHRRECRAGGMEQHYRRDRDGD